MNKKIFVVLFAAVVVFGSLATVAHAGNFISDAVVPFCKDNWEYYAPYYDWQSQGDCVSHYAKNYDNGNNWAPKWCKDFWDHPYYQTYYGWKNQGACVSHWAGN